MEGAILKEVAGLYVADGLTGCGQVPVPHAAGQWHAARGLTNQIEAQTARRLAAALAQLLIERNPAGTAMPKAKAIIEVVSPPPGC